MPERPVYVAITPQPEPSTFVALPGLRNARERARLTRQQLARQADASIDTIRSAEDGTRTLYIATARRIAHALGVSLDDLVGGGA